MDQKIEQLNVQNLVYDESGKQQTSYKQSGLKNVGNYVLNQTALLGQGSFSKVYRGYDFNNGRFQVAIKVIQKNKLNQDLRHLVDSQIKILRLIDHQNIVKFHEIIQDEQNVYIIMQLCTQGDLQTIIIQKGPFDQNEAISIMNGVLKGLSYLSQMNIIHRDIKVANIFMHNHIPKIADFGFAILTKNKKQFKDLSIGSPIYMSPEGIKHNVYGPKTDVWAFGVFIYELLHGKTPYSHCTKQKQLKYNISNPINWNSLKPDLLYSVKQIISKCLEVNYEKRITFQKLEESQLFRDSKINRTYKSQIENSIYDTTLYIKFKSAQLNRQFNDHHQNYPEQTQIKRQKQFNVDYQNKKEEEQISTKNHRNLQNNKNCLKLNGQYEEKQIKFKQTTRTRDEAASIQKNNSVKNDVFTLRKDYSFKDQAFKNKTLILNKVKTPLRILNTQRDDIYQLNKYKQNYKTSPQKRNETWSNTEMSQNKSSTPLNLQAKNNKNLNKMQTLAVSFPSQSVYSYLYLIHFSRILYKLSFVLNQKSNLRQVRASLQRMCIQVLIVLSQKIKQFSKDMNDYKSTFKRRSFDSSLSENLRQIRKTVWKYIGQYQNEFRSNIPMIQVNFSQTNRQLQNQLNLILSDPLKSNQSQKIIKLMCLCSIYLFHYREIICRYFIRQTSRYWFDYNLKYLVNQIQSDIQLSNNQMDFQTYQKIKRKLSERRTL